MRPWLLGLLPLAVVVGCSSSGEATDQGSADVVTSFEYTLEDNVLRNASEELACGDAFTIEGRSRVTCAKGEHAVEIITKNGQAIMIDRASRTSDRKSYASCNLSGNRLACRTTQLRERPSHGGGLVSPFDSTVPGIDLPNAHAVGTSGHLFRSMAPGLDADYDQLFAKDIGAVLIFKNPTGNGHDVSDEVDELKSRGLTASRVKNIPFKWKDLGEFSEPCGQIVDALKFLRSNVAAGRNTLFHCTVGEDRTGFLAAMNRMVEEHVSAGDAWDGDMCEHGYGAGNPLKPTRAVVDILENSLKPLYRKMAYLAATGKLDRLDAGVCSEDPASAADFAEKAPALDRLRCGTSTLFTP